MSIRSYFMAKFYDASMEKFEEACLSDWRSDLLSRVRGNVLEVGSGTGGNLSHYPTSITSLVLTEPDAHMLKLLRKKVEEKYGGKFITKKNAADSIEFPDHSFDSVVSTLVLCSVGSPRAAAQEIARVLKPGGKLYFIEHVLAKDRPHLIKWQKFFQPLWKYFSGNCHLTRDTETEIANAGFSFDKIECVIASGGPSIVSSTIKGIASKK